MGRMQIVRFVKYINVDQMMSFKMADEISRNIVSLRMLKWILDDFYLLQQTLEGFR